MDDSEGLTYNVSRASTLGKFDVALEANATNGSGNVLNLTTFCQADYVPSVKEYFTAFNVVGVALFSLGGLAVTITVLFFADTLRHIIKNVPPAAKTHSAFVLSVYPVVAIATYCAVIVPRAQLLAEAVTQGMFMASLYQLFCLLVAYCGGEAELITSVKPKSLKLKVPPCCCYPCCLLPQLTVNKKHVMFLRLTVLQLPVVQGLLYMILLVMCADEEFRILNALLSAFVHLAKVQNFLATVFICGLKRIAKESSYITSKTSKLESLYNVNYMYFQPIVVTSILIGVWGIIMTMKMLSETLKDYHMQGKYIVLQLVLIFAKFQGLIAKVVVWTGGITCKPPITATVYTNLVYNSVMLTEMVILGFFARLLYKKELPEINASTTATNFQKQICVIGDLTCLKPTSGEKEKGIVNATFTN